MLICFNESKGYRIDFERFPQIKMLHQASTGLCLLYYRFVSVITFISKIKVFE